MGYRSVLWGYCWLDWSSASSITGGGLHDYSGIVGLLDWHLLRTHHENGAVGVNLTKLVAGVPEPSGLCILLSVVAIGFAPSLWRRFNQ